jgi:hypothetical protein
MAAPFVAITIVAASLAAPPVGIWMLRSAESQLTGARRGRTTTSQNALSFGTR